MVVSGGQYNHAARDIINVTQNVLSAPSMPAPQAYGPGHQMVSLTDITLHSEVVRGPGYHIHAGELRGCPILARVFHGAKAKSASEHLQNASRLLRYQCPPPFKRAEVCLATALQDDLIRAFRLASKVIEGLVTALSYLDAIDASFDENMFETSHVLLDYEERVIFCPGISPTAPAPAEDRPNRLWNLFNSIAGHIFDSANGILRHGTDLPPTSHGREFVWSVVEHGRIRLEDLLKHIRDTVTAPITFKRVATSGLGSRYHRCVRYGRQQITFGGDPSDNAIIFHTSPLLDSTCQTCGEEMADQSRFMMVSKSSLNAASVSVASTPVVPARPGSVQKNFSAPPAPRIHYLPRSSKQCILRREIAMQGLAHKPVWRCILFLNDIEVGRGWALKAGAARNEASRQALINLT
ncbi:hypothetical protein B0H14DRAFT_3164701 [Mycena olivaceomarginata]|nr:hypothetical protein B0H14DRAFT_3164701 [Mycena olivaceomarginata]